MSIYTSQGTIRMHYGFNADGEVARKTIYFVPEEDYSIKHKNKNYAVFVLLSGRNCIMKRYNPNKGRGVKLDANETDFMVDISSAHTHQTKVQVVVKATLQQGQQNAILEAAEAAAEAAGAARNQAAENLANIVYESAESLQFIRIVPAE